MGQFKPMVKMMTTEPTVELKLKKGGTVGHKKMKSGGTCKMTGHKMMDGGTPPTVGTPTGGLSASSAPKRPSLASRRQALERMARSNIGAGMGNKGMSAAKSMGLLDNPLGKALSKSMKMKTGGVAKGQGGYKTGGVVKGQGGYKDGGIIRSTTGKTKVVTATANTSPAKTGDVKLGKAGGYKKGGSTKKFAEGGSVQDDGRPQKMAQGNKKPTPAVAINQLSGTFKKGGTVGNKKLQAQFKKENAPAMKAAKANSDLKYSKYQKMQKFADGGEVEAYPSVMEYSEPMDISVYDEYMPMEYTKYDEPMMMETTAYDNPDMYATEELYPIAFSGTPRNPSGTPSPTERGGTSYQPDASKMFKGMGGFGSALRNSTLNQPRQQTARPTVPTRPDASSRPNIYRPNPTSIPTSTSTPKVRQPEEVREPRVRNTNSRTNRPSPFSRPSRPNTGIPSPSPRFADGGYASFDESFSSPAEQLAEMRRRKAMEQGYKGTRERATASNEALLDSLTSLPKSVRDMVKKAMRGDGAVTDTETTVSRTVVPAKKRGGKVKK